MNVEAILSGQRLKQTQASASASTGTTSFSDLLNAGTVSTGSTDLDEIFARASQTYGVSVDLLKAVGKAESNFNPDATSCCGAMGIMQLMPGTASSLGVTNAYDPEQNIMGGAKLLSQLLGQFDGDVSLAVAAYNAGAGNVLKYNGIPPFTETQNYVQRVLGYCGEDITAGTATFTTGSGTSTAETMGEMLSDYSSRSAVDQMSDIMLTNVITSFQMQMYLQKNTDLGTVTDERKL